MTDAEPEISATLDDDTGDFCVDIARHADGTFTYVEYVRAADDPDAWHPRHDAAPKPYPTQYAAYTAAMRDVDWLME
jgi:hypothetical protein